MKPALYNTQKEKKHYRKDMCCRLAWAKIPISTVNWLRSLVKEKNNLTGKAKKSNNMVKAKVKRNNTSYQCNTLPTEGSSREGKPLIPHPQKILILRTSLPCTTDKISVICSMWCCQRYWWSQQVSGFDVSGIELPLTHMERTNLKGGIRIGTGNLG